MLISQFGRVCACGDSMEVKLPRPNITLDPRANSPFQCKFKCRYHDDGITVTLTRIDAWDTYTGSSLSLRIFDPAKEAVPKFDTTYTYLGGYEEKAPYDTTSAIIHTSVNIIRHRAFAECRKMKRCIMHSEVDTIEMSAFSFCTSLDALFLPSNLKMIGYQAFYHCTNIRILPIPTHFNIQQMGLHMIRYCDTFFYTTGIKDHYYHKFDLIKNNEIHHDVLHFYWNLPPLHKACLKVDVSNQTIRDCILKHGKDAASITDHDGMTPLHILAMNPHADTGAIVACFQADMRAIFVRDNRNNTPMDYLGEYNMESYFELVRSLCMHRRANSYDARSHVAIGMDTYSRKRKRVI